ncbi:gliding motility-associated C-terminal domain-containing protein [Maribacter halichondriae]|uniref:T9SS type B sorting domain-containing protein n=1 Tax=Maribacter halichondriae TaxID=2980554 RepID=UPI002359B008|nr:gliding motility-associated C-terminal domain-containing protein [Maribacter sp. Hal144]
MKMLLFIALLSCAQLSFAQPANDDFVNSIDISSLINSCSADDAYTTVNSTGDGNAGSEWNGGVVDNNVWFSFVAPANGQINIRLRRSTSPSAIRYAQIALWEADGLTEIRSENWYTQYDNVNIGHVGLTPGSTYYISVDSHGSSTTGTFALCLEDVMDYDFYEGALDITGFINGCSANAAYNSYGASADRNSASEWSAGGPRHNRWFRFDAPLSGEIRVIVRRGGGAGDPLGTQRFTQLALWEADGVTELASDRFDSAGSHVDANYLGLTPGSTYYISVDSYAGQGSFTLCLQDQVDYDMYEGAVDVTGLINTSSADAAYNTLGASPDLNPGSAWGVGGPRANRWFYFVAPATNQVNITVDIGGAKGSQTRTLIALWEGDGVTEVTSAIYAFPNQDVNLRVPGLIAGNTYYISVDAHTISYRGSFTLGLATDNDMDGIGDRVDFDDDNDGIPDSIDGCRDSNISGTIGIGNNVVDDTYSIDGTDLTYTLNNPDNVEIFGYDAGLNGPSIRLRGDAGQSGSLTSTFSIPIAKVSFKMTDFDNNTRCTIDVYDENNVLYDLTTEGVTQVGSIITQTGNLFVADAVDSDGDDPADDPIGSILFYFEGQVSRIVLSFEYPTDSSTRFTQPVFCSLDTDADGVINIFDLDSDNDGMLDAVESGHGQAHTNGIVSGAVGSDGIPDLVQANPNDGMVNYSVGESADDSDTIHNFLDLDSDGDGIPDQVEAQTTIGYLLPSGSVDTFGVDPAYPSGIVPTNTDSTDNPDYLDTDSDNEGANDTIEAAITLSGNDTDNDGLDDATDATGNYSDVGGTIDYPLTAPVILPDLDSDASSGGDVDFRDDIEDRPDTDGDGIVDFLDYDIDNDGILNTDEGAECIDDDYISWTLNTPPGNLSLDFVQNPSITDWLVVTNTDISFSGITASTPAQQVELRNINANNFSEAFAANDYVEVSFTTGTNLMQPVITELATGWFEPTVGDSYQIATLISSDGFTSYDILSIDIDVNSSYTDLLPGDRLTQSRDEFIKLDENTTYTIRTYVYGHIDDNAADFSVWDDFTIRFSTCENLDTDLDGVFNYLDLDADNDGIFDAAEAGHAQPQTNGRVNGSVGTDGIPDVVQVDPNDRLVNYTVAESTDDTDTLFDFLDLDADGDGLPDNVEAQTTIGYIAPSGTVNANGFDTAYPSGINPTNTDGADAPDYLDLDSDNEGGNDTLEAQITLLNSDADNDGLDDSTDATADYSDVGGTIDDPLSGAIILLDTDKDANSGGDVDFRDAQDDRLDTDTDGIVDAIDLDDDNDGLLDSEELNVIVGNTQPDCTGETILDFSTPSSLESGTALQQGAVYRFSNITSGTDALVTIVETFNASVADIDNNTSEAQAFRPRTAFDISNVGKEGYIEYRMQFVNSGGTTPVTVPKFFININDTDGNVDYSEEIYVENPTNYIVSNPTDLSISYEFPWIVATGGTTEYTGAGNTNPQANFGINYENRSEIRFRAGITTIIPAVAASGREHNLDFRCTTNYINPEIYVLDSDKDGYPNPIDLDTDNDGIYDAVEAGHGQSQTNGRVNGSVGADGVPDAVQADPDNGIVNYTVSESSDDADGMSDFGDLDSDGDGIPDNVEAQTTIGYIAPNGTVDANGVDLAYAAGITPTNTDGSDNPDYMDTDSDNDSRTDLEEALKWIAGADIDNDGLDDRSDNDLSGYSDPGGIIDDPLNAPIMLPDEDNDASTGGDVDFRDASDDRPDNDNDGMPDIVDLDDDNDGILDTDEGCGNLILNASFERDDFTNTATYANAGDNGAYIGADLNTDQISAWDYTQNMDAWVDGGTWAPAFHGRQYMDLIGNATRSGGVMNEFSQEINTVPGNTYTLSLYWGEDYGHLSGTTVDLQIDVIDSSSATIFNDSQTTLAQGPIAGVRGPNTWFYYESTFVATTEQTTVRLTSDAPGPSFHSGANIDFVSVTVTNPSSCMDTDNDGVIDAFDLDSDNDGIFDAVEVGHGQPHTNGVVNGTVGTDGVPDAVQNDPDGETVNYVMLDSDADGVDDILDLDADGDGIPDNVEAQTTIGYVAPSGSIDANGVDTSYTAGLVPTNTDGVDNPDYLDIDSDNEGADDTAEAAITLSGNDTDNDGLDDATDATPDYTDVGGTIDNPLSGTVILPDIDNDANTGGDVDFRDATDDTPLDIDADDDGILDSFEDLNADGDNDPSTNPTDSDGDSYPDYLDIDSDDDGIPDNVEAQATSGYIPPSGTDGNANGLDDAYEANGNIGIIPVNTDGTDLPDYLDSDSDNDNVPDNIEGHDFNHDGVADVTFIGSDKDDDGLNDGYEGAEQIDIDVNDEIDNPINDLPNTDGDDESDYRDTDDDDDGIDTIDEDMDQDGNYANDDFDGDGTPDYLDSDLPIEIDEVEVFNVVTPNGDGVHDILTITGLEVRPENKLRIYTRWGILIYYTESYNTLGNYFDGTSQVRPVGGKENKLPTGTYFYLFEYTDTDGSSKKLSGHLYLN